MKGDFSRQTFDSRKHYSGVLMQQGRVQVDADWNEQEQIQRRRTQIEARDIIGRCGAPRDDAGFVVKVAANKLSIGAGRYYVDGLLAENETDGLAYEAQPDLLDPADWAGALATAKTNLGLVYLDVWERHITPLDDKLLREVALGGPDTATRVKTVWQVHVLPLAASGDPDLLKKLEAQRAALQKKLDDLVAAGGNDADIAALKEELAKIDAAISEIGAVPDCDDDFQEWDDLVADPVRRMNARSQPPSNVDGPCVVPPTAGYRRLENQLYRVEVHTPGTRANATVKWSRDNGTVVTTIEKISGKEVTVHDLGPDDELGFASGKWVELTDDALELAGKAGQLVQIDTVSPSLRRVTLKTAPTPLFAGTNGVDPDRHPKLRRWDQSGAVATANGVPMTTTWMPLEDGVEVKFDNNAFRVGDYWVIPARTATGELEWPPFEIPNAAPEAQPPRGIQHHFCRLALIGFDAGAKAWGIVDDCRKIFPPLTECCDGAPSGALHVTGTNWKNDDPMPLTTIAKDGLRVHLDSAADPASLTNDTVQVALELPVGQGQAATANQVHRVYFRGVVTRDATDDRVIVWRPQQQTVGPALGPRRRASRASPFPGLGMDALRATVARLTVVQFNAFVVRVTLKGHFIWADGARDSGESRFLDGQAFGRPATRANGSSRIDLAFPSGAGAPASDFESWFAFGTPARTGFKVAKVRFLTVRDTLTSAGEVTPPLEPDQTVLFKAGEQVQAVEIAFTQPVAEDTLGEGDAASVFITQERGNDRSVRLDGEVRMVGTDVVRYTLRRPEIFEESNHVLVIKGNDASGAPGGLLAAEDRAALDGDYDEKAGGDFMLPFQVV